jgi:hypothetical protein
VRRLLVAAREATPPGATFLSNDDFLSAALRYSALRPIVFAPFDRGMFAYTDFPGLMTWMEQSRRVEEAARRIGSGRGDLVAEYLDLARAFGAEHVALVAERPEDLRVPVELRTGVLFHDAEQGLLLARVPARWSRPGQARATPLRSPPARCARPPGACSGLLGRAPGPA